MDNTALSATPPRVLVVDDDPDILKAATLMLSRRGYEPTVARDPAEAWSLLAEHGTDVLLLDLNFGPSERSGEEGLSFLDRLFRNDQSLVVVVVTGHSGVGVAVAAMRAGAYDFVIKPWNNARFAATIEAALAERRRRLALADSVVPAPGDALLLGESQAIQRIRTLVARVAPTEAAVLIHGPSGSGKSLVARTIHRASRRVEGPFRVLDLVALERADAEARITTAIRTASGGTIVLDRLEGLPTFARAPLSSALEDPSADVRLIATARDRTQLHGAEGPGGDIIGRLATIEIAVPPLSEQGDDVLMLARHFLRQGARRNGVELKPFSAQAEAAITTATWPDGVRGLALVMERAAILAEGAEVEATDLTLEGEGGVVQNSPKLPATDSSLATAERIAVEAALRRHSFNITHAAGDLGITRAALYRRMARHGL